MHILTILGSPRKKGNTAAVLGAFEALAAARHTIERIHITDYHVQGCLGCDVCQHTPDAPGCKQKDDALIILERMMAADLVVYASPLYVWDVTAQLKALMDRHYCLVKWNAGESRSLVAGKPVMLLITCGGGVENNADLVQEIFRREMEYAGCRVVGLYIVPDCTTPQALGERAGKTAQEMLVSLEGW
ncbi:MAG TPA: flavodoxin family protein [Anaerolineaceae bacterium]